MPTLVGSLADWLRDEETTGGLGLSQVSQEVARAVATAHQVAEMSTDLAGTT